MSAVSDFLDIESTEGTTESCAADADHVGIVLKALEAYRSPKRFISLVAHEMFNDGDDIFANMSWADRVLAWRRCDPRHGPAQGSRGGLQRPAGGDDRVATVSRQISRSFPFGRCSCRQVWLSAQTATRKNASCRGHPRIFGKPPRSRFASESMNVALSDGGHALQAVSDSGESSRSLAHAHLCTGCVLLRFFPADAMVARVMRFVRADCKEYTSYYRKLATETI